MTTIPFTGRRLLPLLTLTLFAADVADAQIWRRARDAARRGVERAVENQAERRAREAADAAIDGMFEAGETAVRCVFTDDACIEAAQDRGDAVILTDEDGTPVDRNGDAVDGDTATEAVLEAPQGAASSGPAPAAAPAASRPGEGAWANYDFVPGARVLYAEDFESDYVGNVPARIEFNGGLMEVVEEGGNQMLRFGDAGSFAIPLPEVLPERFTIEFDLYHGDTWNYTTLGTGPLDDPDDGYHVFHGDLKNHSAAEFRVGSFFQTGVSRGASGGEALQEQDAHEQGMVPIRIAVDGSYVKMYVGENRVANVPNADVQRTDRVLWTAAGEIGAIDDGSVGPVLVDNIRIAAGGREVIYDQLLAEGRIALGGILFDTASARLRPESTPTLQDLHRTLERNPGLRVRIEGHTDATGSADANQRLSQERAEAVVAWLTGEGVAPSRLEAVGMGQTQPAADNATPEGRQTNRRVEVVRL